MCLSPIVIKDPKWNGQSWKDKDINGNTRIHYIKDEFGIHESKQMYVPCGVCKQCIALAQMDMIQRIQMESIGKDIYMMTCTYNDEHLPRLITSQGYQYRYADYKDISFMIERMRENNIFEGRKFKWLAVSERGGKKARPHFHVLLLFNSKDIGEKLADKYAFEQEYKWKILNYWERPYYETYKDKKGKYKKRIHHYEDCSTYIESHKYGQTRATYDFHYINPNPAGITNAAFYVLKYMMKGSTHDEKIRQALMINYEEEESKAYWNTIKSRREYSLGFGLGINYDKMGKDRKIKEEICNEEIINYLRRCINDSKREKLNYATYFSPEELSTFPLSNYYKKIPFIYNIEDERYFYNLDPEKYKQRYLTPERLTSDEIVKEINKWERIIKLQECEDIADTFDELFRTKNYE